MNKRSEVRQLLVIPLFVGLVVFVASVRGAREAWELFSRSLPPRPQPVRIGAAFTGIALAAGCIVLGLGGLALAGFAIHSFVR